VRERIVCFFGSTPRSSQVGDKAHVSISFASRHKNSFLCTAPHAVHQSSRPRLGVRHKRSTHFIRLIFGMIDYPNDFISVFSGASQKPGFSMIYCGVSRCAQHQSRTKSSGFGRASRSSICAIKEIPRPSCRPSVPRPHHSRPLSRGIACSGSGGVGPCPFLSMRDQTARSPSFQNRHCSRFRERTALRLPAIASRGP